jgi:hypothetical protein
LITAATVGIDTSAVVEIPDAPKLSTFSLHYFLDDEDLISNQEVNQIKTA